LRHCQHTQSIAGQLVIGRHGCRAHISIHGDFLTIGKHLIAQVQHFLWCALGKSDARIFAIKSNGCPFFNFACKVNGAHSLAA